ncbi:C40 family peptidase [Nocardia mangyaensis]|uniref:C40 family peptidase n=1 Tax=Nocardia mangyaensis TaxID=2213200 RepID=UPI0026754703|nr:CHAP domain-containing protein [Nocardia mangyaensis]MDO3648216.1 CHAP domain-containing protein [Nocardia mangyaensis]
MTSRAELVGFIELYVPKIAGGFVESTIHAAEEYFETAILLFASGDGARQPDLVNWMKDRQLLDDAGLSAPSGLMAEDYSSQQREVEEEEQRIEEQGDAVRDSTFATFDLSNSTYISIKERVGRLDTELRSIHERVDTHDLDSDGNTTEYLPLTATEDMRALRLVMNAVGDVHREVDNASTVSRNHADVIDGSHATPVVYSGGGPAASGHYPAPTWTPTSASYIPSSMTDPTDRALAAARSQLGVREFGNNTVNAPYNINDAWCASFADWVWDQAGHEVTWTNKNYVPAIWNDAQGMGLAASPHNAEPGDMIVFDWDGGVPDHIGIVVRVDGDTIYTIEGNTGGPDGVDGVYEKARTISSGNIVGVVKQPPSVASADQPRPGELLV